MNSCNDAKPCNDCPWRRKSAQGWLGDEMDAADWVGTAHSNATVECHKRLGDAHCVGLAIYRANVCKLPLPPNPVMPPDRELVFASPMEFHEHHTRGEKLPADWITRQFR